MELNTLLLAALQSSFILGLLHGINPCGHSWLVLAPFTTGEKNGKRVALLSFAFLFGTALACIALGASLGAVSQSLPASVGIWVEVITSLALLLIGALLLYKPHILHNHDHEHDHNHDCHHDHDCHDHRPGIMARLKKFTKNKKILPYALFSIGFINMIIPCPTVAVMYGYALNSGSLLSATLVFATYAVSTAVAVGLVIFLIFKATHMAHSLQKEWIEPFIMKLSGLVIIVFAGYGLYGAIISSTYRGAV
ncbi:urease accessory protein UreH domain-containing protein [Desulfotalea psychrophila]|uniref:Urease accessory protein UreH-like transmembrane domain-containing protein n=1 Tax=Desulfotalea psychrophila (strain LSv54 / DSM 12343) TaxID=177439 RepID=Q6AN47_DESPS|nr:sulfite exporter TauE/SafE family protein [Desulfotalea psychrophila]CAG36227.1 unknown protein [Desulfotalea psychrophila LSv54]